MHVIEWNLGAGGAIPGATAVGPVLPVALPGPLGSATGFGVLGMRGNGALGSIVKPLFLLEQLVATRLGFPHANLGALEPCPQKWRGQDGRTYRCDHAHWNDGTDPVLALAKSCNTFYFQVAEAMGEEGLRRALWRFGMLEAGEGGGDGRYQPRPAELPANLAAAPMWIWRAG